MQSDEMPTYDTERQVKLRFKGECLIDIEDEEYGEDYYVDLAYGLVEQMAKVAPEEVDIDVLDYEILEE